MALKAALRSYAAARELITTELAPLLRPQLNSIRDSIAEAFGVSTSDTTNSTTTTTTSGRRVRWDAKEMSEWVAGLTELVSRFEERVETLLTACDKIDECVVELGCVGYEREAFVGVLGKIQAIVDELSLAGFTDLKSWVVVLNDKLGMALKTRLERSLWAWSRTFQVKDGDESNLNDEEKDDGQNNKDYVKVKIPPIGLEILLRNQEISSSPSIPTVRTLFLKELHRFVGIVCSLPRPTSGRFEIFDLEPNTNNSSNNTNYSETLTFSRLVQEASPQALAKAYSTIESHMMDVSSFCNKWFAYQTL